MRRFGDDDGQNDGDSEVGFSGAVQFQGAGQPWLRAPTVPWHMWGSTLLIEAEALVPGTDNATSHTIARISYRRPETWHWLFAARLKSAPLLGLGDSIGVQVHFDLMVGVGRTNVVMRSFEILTFTWDSPPNTAPLEQLIFSTEAVGIRQFNRLGGVVTTTPVPIHEITAQDLVLSARIVAFLNGGIPVTQQLSVEVSGHFAPKNHVRPEWFQQPAPPELKFPGAEIGGT